METTHSESGELLSMSTTAHPHSGGSPPSEDQQAIAEYFASPAYRRRAAGSTVAPDQAFRFDFLSLDHDVGPPTSFAWGLLGLVGILALLGFLTPFEIQLIEHWFGAGRPGFVIEMMMFQTMLFPAAIAFSFATVTPMFWYGSIVLRFAIAAAMATFGCFAFFVAATFTDDFSVHDFWMGFGCVMFAHFLTAGSIALTIQMWSPWALSHARPRGSSLPTLGTRSLMELTVIAAVGFAVVVSIDAAEYLEGMLFFTALGGLSSLAVINTLIAFLRERRRNIRAAIMSGALAFGSACLLTVFFAVVEYGWYSLVRDGLWVAAVSVYGAVLISAVIWLCLWWLRSCGWKCLNRRDAAAGAGRDATTAAVES